MRTATHAYANADPVAASLTLARDRSEDPHAVRPAKRLSRATADLPDKALLLAETREQLTRLRSPNQVEAVRAAMGRRGRCWGIERPQFRLE